MVKLIIQICVAFLVSTHALAFGQQSNDSAPKLPVVSLCHIISHCDQYQNKVVCVRASLQSVYLYSYVIGFILVSPNCEYVDALFEQAEDEKAVLDTLGDAEQVEVTATGTLRGTPWPYNEFNYGLKGIPKLQLVIESISIVKPLRKGP